MLRSQLKDQRQHLRELNRRSSVVQFQTFNYEAMDETRRALSEQLMAEQSMHETDRHERDALAAARIEKLEKEIAALDSEVRETASKPPMPGTSEAEVDGARARADQLTEAIAAVRAELEAEIVREQREVQRILVQLEVEQSALEVAQAACTELEGSIAAYEDGISRPPPVPPSEER